MIRLNQKTHADWLSVMDWGNHHMGTSRMSTDPKRGVVDSDSRVHGIANLYVAGSSVFPTYGASNPTMNLVALTLRLAAHLRKQFR
jgi:choline dehydrogenase-like flavoprotein